jgi:hypothetical protein
MKMEEVVAGELYVGKTSTVFRKGVPVFGTSTIVKVFSIQFAGQPFLYSLFSTNPPSHLLLCPPSALFLDENPNVFRLLNSSESFFFSLPLVSGRRDPREGLCSSSCAVFLLSLATSFFSLSDCGPKNTCSIDEQDEVDDASDTVLTAETVECCE